MLSQIKSFIHAKDINDFGQKIFYLGIFLLPSALPFSGLFFIGSLAISFTSKKNKFFEDKLNLLLIISLIFIIFSTLNNVLIDVPYYTIYKEKSLILISLFNWIPIFLCYWGFQNYLNTLEKRIISSKFLVSGIFPLLISCIMQYFFSLNGPYRTLFGLIVWFNKPMMELGGVTGLFSNPNYLGTFLVLTIPFIYFLVESEKKNSFNKTILYIFLILSVFFAFASNSRYALFGLIICLLLIKNINKYFLIFIFTFGGSYILQNLFTNFMKLNILNIMDLPSRIRIWMGAFSLIKERPLWGWGGSTFAYMLQDKSYLIPYKNLEITHSHNLVLEIAYNFGIPVAFLLSFVVLNILFKTFKDIIILKKTQNNFFNKIWFFSFVNLLLSHLTDVTYYDGKISLIFIILLSGLRCIKKEIINPNS